MRCIQHVRHLALTLSALPLLATGAEGQNGSALLFGTVVDSRTHGPIRGALIVQVGQKRSITSDSLGFYRFPNLKAGIARFLVQSPNYPPTTFTVALANGERMERDIELDSSAVVAQAPSTADSLPGDSTRRPSVATRPDSAAQALPEVTVEAAPSLGRRFADFERRRAVGRGHFLTRTQIEEMGATTLQDAVRNLRGVTIRCGGRSAWDCSIYMARSRGCAPEYWVDERNDNWFGPTVPVRDIEAIEVYMGASDVPGEFAGSNAACGVVVIWTKSGPPRRQK